MPYIAAITSNSHHFVRWLAAITHAARDVYYMSYPFEYTKCIHMKTPKNTFDASFAKLTGINENLLSDNELQDIVTIAQTLDAFGEEQNLRIFFAEKKDMFISTQEYLKVAQVRDVEKFITA